MKQPESEIDHLGRGIHHISRQKGPVRHHGLLCIDTLQPGQVVVDLHPSGLRVTTLKEFADGKAVGVEWTRPVDQAAALGRLRQILDRGARYNLLGRNCEHFVEFVLYGVSRSRQVRSAVAGAASVALGLALLRVLRR